MKEPNKKQSITAQPDSPRPTALPQEPSMQQRLRAETANFDFDTLLNGGSPVEAETLSAGTRLESGHQRPAASSMNEITSGIQSSGFTDLPRSSERQEKPEAARSFDTTNRPGYAADPGVDLPKATSLISVPRRARGHLLSLGALVILSACIMFTTTRWHDLQTGVASPTSKEGKRRLAFPAFQGVPAASPSPQVPLAAKEGIVMSKGSALQARPIVQRTGTMRLQVANTLTGPFLYWFVAASEQASPPQALPPRAADGRVSLPIPAAYNHAGAHVRVLDQSLGKVARLPLTDFSRPEEVVEPQVGVNVLRDEKAGDMTHAWMLERSGPSAQGTLQRRDTLEGPVGVSGRVLRLEVSVLGTLNWHVQCYQNGVTMQEGKNYQFAFWAKADRARKLSVSAILDKPDWHPLGLSGSVFLTTTWQKYVVPFTAHHCVPNHGRVSFLLGDALGIVNVAGITLRPGTGRSVSYPRAANGAVELTLADFH